MYSFLLPLLLLFSSYAEPSSSKSRSIQCEIRHKSKLNSRCQENKYSKTKLRNIKTRKNNERNTQKECQGRQQTRRLQNQEKEMFKDLTILDVNNQQDIFFYF